MTSKKHIAADSFFTIVTLIVVFLVNLFLVEQFDTKTMTPMIFVLGVFLVSWRTQGYFFGIASSLLSVLAVNWAFTYPYWAFDLISPECISAAVVMLVVSIMTGTLTTKIKEQEKMKAVAERAADAYEVEFLYRDFRPVFKAGQEFARKHDFYMQKYCGCVFSEEERYLKRSKIIP